MGGIKTFCSFHLLVCFLTIDTTWRSCHYKIVNNVPFLNTKLYTFRITYAALCSFCNTLEETPIHIFFDCIHDKCLGKDYK